MGRRNRGEGTALEIIEAYGLILLIMAAAFGFFMAWGVGANDVANAMGTSVGSGAITIRQAIVIAVILSSPEPSLLEAKSQAPFARALSIHKFWKERLNCWCLE